MVRDPVSSIFARRFVVRTVLPVHVAARLINCPSTANRGLNAIPRS